MDRTRTNQLLGLGRRIISITAAVLTGHCVVGSHAERMKLPFDGFCRKFRSAEEEETVIHLLCQCPSLARCRCRSFDSPIFISLSQLLSSIDVKDIGAFINLLPGLVELDRYRDCVHL